MSNCKRCYKFCESKCNACDNKMMTTNCDPNNPNLWYKHELPKGLDPVLSNIYNGCWLCNFEPQQTENNKLCNRNFFNGPMLPPYDVGERITLETKMRNMDKKYNKYHSN